MINDKRLVFVLFEDAASYIKGVLPRCDVHEFESKYY